MKRIEFEITPSIHEIFFPNNRVKSKLQVLEILMEATRYMLSYAKEENNKSSGKLILIVDKMSRLFFQNEKKSYTITFPFLVLYDENEIKFISKDNLEIDSFLISNTVTVINSGSIMDASSLDFYGSLLEYEYNDDNFWIFFRDLLLLEDGYIRYDTDEKGYLEAKEKGYEHRHPLTHCDLFYTNRATFKLGLEKELSLDDFIDIVNIKTDCRYMKNWR